MTEQTLTVQVQEFCDPKTHTINLSRLFAASERQRTQLATINRPFAENRPQPLASLPPALASLFAPLVAQCQALVPVKRPIIPVKGIAAVLPRLFAAPEKTRGPIRLPKANRYGVKRAEGSLSRIQAQAYLHETGEQTVSLPFFAEQHITAAALKSLCGQPQDVLLKREGERWRIVDDTELVDLKNEPASLPAWPRSNLQLKESLLSPRAGASGYLKSLLFLKFGVVPMQAIGFWILVFFASLFGLALLPYLAFLVIRVFSRAATGLTQLFSGGLRDIRDDFGSKQLEREIAAQVSEKQAASHQSRFFGKKSERQDIFAAAAVLKTAMVSCCEVQHFTAEVLNVEHMSEVQETPSAKRSVTVCSIPRITL